MSGVVKTVRAPAPWLWDDGGAGPDDRLSPNFGVLELIPYRVWDADRDELADDLAAICVRSAILCAAVLEPWRERVGALMVNHHGHHGRGVRLVESGVKGASATSRHPWGDAADVTPVDAIAERGPLLGVRWAFEMLRSMSTPYGLPVDQAIWYRTYIHVGMWTMRAPRRQFLVAESELDPKTKKPRTVYRKFRAGFSYDPVSGS